MLAGLAYLHHKGVIRRDISSSNILINRRGELKLADSDHINHVITLWYRPLELLLGETAYGPEIGM